jgi:hypothetical protein
VIYIPASDVHMLDDAVTECLEVEQRLADLGFTIHSSDPCEGVESMTCSCGTTDQENERQAEEGTPPPAEPKRKKH